MFHYNSLEKLFNDEHSSLSRSLAAVAAGVGITMAPLFILAVHREIASPLLPLAFSSFGGRGVGGGGEVRRKLCGAGRKG